VLLSYTSVVCPNWESVSGAKDRRRNATRCVRRPTDLAFERAAQIVWIAMLRPASWTGLAGVREALFRGQPGGSPRGTGGGTCTQSGSKQERPVCLALSGKDQGHKPMVKILGGQREPDGVVVPLIGVQHNAPGEGPQL
jgi:hypothetical protein